MSSAADQLSGSSAVVSSWHVKLYVVGGQPAARRALANLERICDEHLGGRCEIEVIDLEREPARAEEHQVIATPTLVRVSPEPPRKIIGDLSLTESVLAALDLSPEGTR